jgi:L-alanine-DL-glutamate epimerase-like enolase superfamily enzyme
VSAALDRIEIHRLRVPLVVPYRLAFGPIKHFDTILVEIVDRNGCEGVGEATVLTGYTDETIDGAWRAACEFADTLAGAEPRDVDRDIARLGERYPFTATAFGTALDMLRAHPALEERERVSVPLVGLLNADSEPAISTEVDALLATGFRTIKMKVGFDAERDAKRVRIIQHVVGNRARIRLDANQGYTAEQGVAFVRALDPAGIELFEQPCAAGDWDANLAVARAAAVPMMLDESIYGTPDIERASELRAASYIKVKLMKLVTIDRLEAAIARIRALGMKPVLGNGVACDVGCWMEACVAARTIDNAGEMNGFLKSRDRLFAQPLRFEDGAIVLEPGFAPSVDRDRVARHRVAAAHAGACERQR